MKLTDPDSGWVQGLNALSTPSEVDAFIEEQVKAAVDNLNEQLDAENMGLSVAQRAHIAAQVTALIRERTRVETEKALHHLRH